MNATATATATATTITNVKDVIAALQGYLNTGTNSQLHDVALSLDSAQFGGIQSSLLGLWSDWVHDGGGSDADINDKGLGHKVIKDLISSLANVSTPIESTPIESTSIESAPVDTLLANIKANMVPDDTPAPAPAPVARVTIDSLVSECPELRKLTVGQMQQYSKKEIASRFILRAFVSRALAGSSIDWQDKSIKGAMLTTAEKDRAKLLETKANEWKGMSQSQIIDAVNELLINVHSALIGKVTTRVATPELEKARKYIRSLSAETLATLRAEGVI